MNGWQGIETAPKDGTLILAWDGRAPLLAYWGRSDAMSPLGWIGGHCRINHITQPKMWQPLPPPPSLNKEE